jgi:dTDP-4-amino-4,6-dideoxygalactose transaminase
MKRPTYVTQPFLPPIDEFIKLIEQIWDSRQLTNCGPLHQRLEQRLCEYLGVRHVSLFTNATIALMTSFKMLNVAGEVITTPYSFIATANALVWSGLTPVFVDIDPVTLNIDPEKIESAITPRTSAILGVHCYGRACDVEKINQIALKYDLKVIYDAAHAFGTTCHCGSVLSHGDLSILSFHATKVFSTFEGGAIISPSIEAKLKIDQLKNFGFVDECNVSIPGINGKMNEICAAFGLLQLDHVDEAIALRKIIDETYRDGLRGVRGIKVLNDRNPSLTNFSYFPILVTDEYPIRRDELFQLLKVNHIYARRYFYPLISEFDYYRNLPSSSAAYLPVASDASSRILCLPIFPHLDLGVVNTIISILKSPG